ncbi:MAG: hypothetical protein JWR21_2388 [Herminiimonas sp.]|nr:hypothetical protein [Herminiimonas sp.]
MLGAAPLSAATTNALKAPRSLYSRANARTVPAAVGDARPSEAMRMAVSRAAWCVLFSANISGLCANRFSSCAISMARRACSRSASASARAKAASRSQQRSMAPSKVARSTSSHLSNDGVCCLTVDSHKSDDIQVKQPRKSNFLLQRSVIIGNHYLWAICLITPYPWGLVSWPEFGVRDCILSNNMEPSTSTNVVFEKLELPRRFVLGQKGKLPNRNALDIDGYKKR